MNEIAQQVSIIIGLLAASFAGPLLAIGFLVVRKRRARARRRSPVAIDLLRGPVHTLREQLDDVGADVLSDVFMLMLVPLLALATFLAQSHLRGPQKMSHLVPIYAVLVLIFVAVVVRKLWRAGEQLDKLKADYDAELAVGQELDQLMRHGAHVFHEFPAGNFNIDHVVIAPEGIFAVETKGTAEVTGGQPLSDQDVQRVVHQVQRRCRTVAPRYSEKERAS
ncbi:nuclease-related domain-containing protein [Variovorax sp. RA8]|uniref:nuclease-related domain-containing protein n=1 Tax=Variovorax sp. (strain JCM 16519 / RA8) TaxID=662548 RepID=UPI000AF68567|nr:nuclease-related domain-containing protein [Variovorax sp. RA8]VTU13480.1 Nuclease-related domain protein [Variovorax sp. RA8]